MPGGYKFKPGGGSDLPVGPTKPGTIGGIDPGLIKPPPPGKPGASGGVDSGVGLVKPGKPADGSVTAPPIKDKTDKSAGGSSKVAAGAGVIGAGAGIGGAAIAGAFSSAANAASTIAAAAAATKVTETIAKVIENITEFLSNPVNLGLTVGVIGMIFLGPALISASKK